MLRTLRRGMTGSDVRDFQAALNYHLRPPAPPHTPAGPPRPPLNTDGIFGPVTEARVKEFQQLNRLVVDGAIGPNTERVLLTARLISVKIPIQKKNDIVSLGATSATPPSNAGTVAQAQPAPSPPLIAPIRLQNRQVQFAGNLTLAPIVGPGALGATRTLSVQWNWVEQKDGRHLEFALGAQLGKPMTSDAFGLTGSLQSFAQVSVSDVIAFDAANFHLFSPSAQIAFQSNFTNSILKSNNLGLSVQNQITWDTKKDGKNAVFSLFCQQQLGWTYDLTARKGTIAPSFLLGAIWTTNFF